MGVSLGADFSDFCSWLFSAICITLHLQGFKNIQIIQHAKDKPAFDLLKTYRHATYDKIKLYNNGSQAKKKFGTTDL